MNKDEMKKIAEKIASGDATSEEKLIFMEELNRLLDDVKSDLI